MSFCNPKIPFMFCKEMCPMCKDKAERKAIWMAKTTAHFDSKKIRKEASDMFDKANEIL